MPATREQRLENLAKNENSRNQQILNAINEFGQRFQREMDATPAEYQDAVHSRVYMERIPVFTLDDFYVYDYDNEFLPAMADELFKVVRAIQAAADALTEELQDIQHNYDPTDEDREEKMYMLQQLISKYENLADEAAHSHGGFIAAAKALDSTSYQFEHYDDFMKILDG